MTYVLPSIRRRYKVRDLGAYEGRIDFASNRMSFITTPLAHREYAMDSDVHYSPLTFIREDVGQG